MSSSKECSLELNLDELIKDKDGDKDRVIGRSDYSVVFSGLYHERKVAIKETAEKEDEDFNRDRVLMERFHHDAIVEFIGAVLSPEKQVIVMELCEYGSLNQAMDEYLEEFNLLMKVTCLLNVSSAMCYLHGQSLIHKDLKPQNVLIVSLDRRRSAVVAKLADFGTARAEKRINCVLSTGTGYDPFMAPEILQRSTTFDKSIDVYSFAMLMYYIFAEKLPTEDACLTEGSDPFGRLASGERPKIPPTCSNNYGRLMQECWNQDPSKRPSFEQIFVVLRDCMEECRYGKEGAIARQKAAELIHEMKLDTEEEIEWKTCEKTKIIQLCELLKRNTIPTKKLELKGMIFNS